MKTKLLLPLLVAFVGVACCSRQPQTIETQPVVDVQTDLSGGRLPEWFAQVQTNMTEQQVSVIMKVHPDNVHPTMWEYLGGFAESEPHPVREVFRIHLHNGLVTRLERTLSDCIYVVPETE